MNKKSLKKNLLATASVVAMGAFAANVASAATQTVGNTTAALATSGDLIHFTSAAGGTATIATAFNLAGSKTDNVDIGTLTFAGNSTVSADVGTVGDLELLLINLSSTAGTTVAFATDVTAESIIFVEDSIVTFADNSFIGGQANQATDTTVTSDITADAGGTTTGQGTITFLGTSTSYDGIGDSTNYIKVLNAGATGETVTLAATAGDVWAVTTNITGTGSLVLTGDAVLTGTTVDFDAAGTISVGDDGDIIAAITNSTGTTGVGTVDFTAGGTVTGTIGTSTAKIANLKIASGNGSKTVAATGNIFSTAITYGTHAAATLTLADNTNVTSSITAGGDDLGVLTFLGTSTFTGNIAATGVELKTVNAGVTGEAVTIVGNVFADNLKITGNGTVTITGDSTITDAEGIDFDSATGVLVLSDGSDVTGVIQNSTTDHGTLTVLGSSTITGTIGGTTGDELLAININGAGKTLTTQATVDAETVNFGADATWSIAAGTSIMAGTDAGVITTTTDGTGTLTFLGTSTVGDGAGLGDIGTTTNRLKVINAGVAGTTLTLVADVFADDLVLGSTTTSGTVTLDTVTGAMAIGITNGITTATADIGALIIDADDGSGDDITITSDIGTSAKNLASVSVIGDTAGSDALLTGDIYTKTLVFTGAASELILSDNSDITVGSTGATATTDNDGILSLSGSSVLTGDFGTSTNDVGTINIDSTDAADTVRFSGTVYTENFNATGSLATIRIDQGETVTSEQGITSTLAGSATYQFGVKEVAGGTDLIGVLASAGAIDLSNANGAVLVDGTGDFIANNAFYKVVDGVGAATLTDGTSSSTATDDMTDNSYALAFKLVRGDFSDTINGAALAIGGSNSDLYVVAERDNAYNTAATSGSNESSVGTALEAIANSGDDDLDSIVGALDALATAAEVEAALETLTSDVSGAVTSAAISATDVVVEVLGGRLDQLAMGETTGVAAGNGAYKSGVWAQAFGSASDQSDRDGIAGYQSETGGATLGADTMISDQAKIGASFSYANTDADTGNDDIEIDSYNGTVYGTYDYGQWFANALAGFTQSNFDSSRRLFDGSVASADFDGQQYTAKIGAGYKLKVQGGLQVTPLASLRYTHLVLDDYTETGSTGNLSVDNDDIDVLKSELGFKLAYPIVDGGITYIPKLRASWFYDFIGDEQEATNNFTSVPSVLFTTNGADVAQSSIDIGLGLDILAQDNVTVSFDYDWITKEDYESHNGAIKARLAF